MIERDVTLSKSARRCFRPAVSCHQETIQARRWNDIRFDADHDSSQRVSPCHEAHASTKLVLQHVLILALPSGSADTGTTRCTPDIANLQKMAVEQRREAEPTTQRRYEVGLAVRQATIKILAECCRQYSSNPITVSRTSHAKPLQFTMRFPEILSLLLGSEEGMKRVLGQTCDFL